MCGFKQEKSQFTFKSTKRGIIQIKITKSVMCGFKQEKLQFTFKSTKRGIIQKKLPSQ